ncbi:MAG: hypothetical protein FJX77_06660 [Armatimonadetes bacterium]|nr:hypothetical protein [Armatimonadota bacterium]
MEPELASAEGAGRYQIGTPGILGLAALEGALVPLEEAGIGALREKSVALTGYLLELCRELLTPYGFQIVTPPEPGRRGGHVALSHPAAREYCEALARANVVADFRRPDILRLAPSPLYIGYHDCLEAIRRLHVLAVQDGGSCCSGALPGSPTTTGALHPTLH